MSGRHLLEARHRPLMESEIHVLQMRSASLQRRGRSAISAGFWIGAIAMVLLWAATLIASDAPFFVITGFWILVGATILLWVKRDLKADSRTMDDVAARLDSAIRRNQAVVYDIRASAFVAFDEFEDEGAGYAFQLGGNRLVFLKGQEFYEEARFPSLDFSLIFPLDEAGRRVDMLIEKRGPKAKPQRRISATVKAMLSLPEDLEVVRGTLDGIEDLLKR